MGKTKRAVMLSKDKREKTVDKVRGRPHRKAKGHHTTVTDQEFELYLLRTHGLQIHLMRGDGNCLFRSIAHQMQQDPENHHYAIRARIIEYMETNKDFYSMFIEDDVSWDNYIDGMKTAGTWGGYQELCAASAAFNLTIHVYQWNEPKYVIQPTDLMTLSGAGNFPKRVIMLSFHDGCHYNSLLPADPKVIEKSIPISTNSTNSENVYLPQKKERKPGINSSNTREDYLESIKRAVNWATEDEINSALDWADNDENDAIELLCSHLHSLRALLAVNENQKRQEQQGEAPSVTVLPDVSNYTSKVQVLAAEAATADANATIPEVLESSNNEPITVCTPTTSSGRPLSKKEQRQKERQEKENAKRKPTVIIKPPAVVAAIQKINTSSKPRSEARVSDNADHEVQLLRDSMREIVV